MKELLSCLVPRSLGRTVGEEKEKRKEKKKRGNGHHLGSILGGRTRREGKKKERLGVLNFFSSRYNLPKRGVLRMQVGLGEVFME